MFLSTFLGPQGAGKDTQARLLEQEGLIKAYSVGEILREVSKTNAKIKDYLDRGVLVPKPQIKRILLDFLQNKIVELQKQDVQHLVLTGFPRSVEQIKVLNFLLKNLPVHMGKVFYFELSRKQAILRLENRYICPKCGAIYNLITNPPKNGLFCDYDGTKLVKRHDDANLQAIKTRLDIFYNKTIKIVDFFEQYNCVVRIDASKTIQEIFEQIKNEK